MRTKSGHIVAIVEAPNAPSKTLRRAVHDTLSTSPAYNKSRVHVYLLTQEKFRREGLNAPANLQAPFVGVYKPAGRANTPPTLVATAKTAANVDTILRQMLHKPASPRPARPARPAPTPSPQPPKKVNKNNTNNALVRRYGFNMNTLVGNAQRSKVSLNNKKTLGKILDIKYEIIRNRVRNRNVHTAYGLAKTRLDAYISVQKIRDDAEKTIDLITTPLKTPIQKRAWTNSVKSSMQGLWNVSWWVFANWEKIAFFVGTALTVARFFAPEYYHWIIQAAEYIIDLLPVSVKAWFVSILWYGQGAAGAKKTFENAQKPSAQGKPLQWTWKGFASAFFLDTVRSRAEEAMGDPKAFFRRQWVENPARKYTKDGLSKAMRGAGGLTKTIMEKAGGIAAAVASVYKTSPEFQQKLLKLSTMPANSTTLFEEIKGDSEIRSLYLDGGDDIKRKSFGVFAATMYGFAKGNMTLASDDDKTSWQYSTQTWKLILDHLPV